MLVGAETGGLAAGGGSLERAGVSLRNSAAGFLEEGRACASATSGALASALERFAVASHCYADELGIQVEAIGWLAQNVAADLEAVDRGPAWDAS